MLDISELEKRAGVEEMLTIAASHGLSDDDLARTREQFIRELFEIGDNRLVFLGRQDNEAVAMIQIVLKRADNDPELADGKTIAHLHNLQVRADLQRQGIGTKMMAFAEEMARKMGKDTLTLGVDDNNPGAICLYEKLGFFNFKVEPGRTPEEKCLLMKKAL